MNNAKILLAVAIVVVCCAAVVIGLSVIPEHAPRRAGRNLLDAVSHSNRLYERALFVERRGEEKTATAPAAAPAGRKIPLNIRALELLKRAENHLRDALDANPRAETNAVSLANRFLSTVSATIGRLRLHAASQGQAELRRQARQAKMSISDAAEAVNLIKYYQIAAGGSNRDVEQMLSQAESDVASLDTKIKSIKDKLDESQKLHDTLQDKNENLLAQIRELRTKSRLTTGKKSLDLFNQSLELQAKVNQANSRINQIENEQDKQKAVLEDLLAQQASAKLRLKAAGEILAARRSNTENINEIIAKHEQSLSGAINLLRGRIEKIVDLCSDITDNRARALDAYTRAGGYMQSAISAKTDIGVAPEEEPLLFAMQGEMYQSLGAANNANILLANQIASLTGDLDKLARNPGVSMGEALGALKDCMPDIEQARAGAEEAYTKAAELLARAVDEAPDRLKWAYQGALASAYVGLYRLNGDAEARRMAIEARDMALEGKEPSPFLEPIRQIKP